MSRINIENYFNTLTRESVENDLDFVYDKNAVFKDPFNEVEGIEKVRAIFLHMYETLDNPRFIVLEKMSETDKLFLTWDFIFELNKKEYVIHGSSYLKLNEFGQIKNHRDYWDVGEELLSKIPILKQLYGIFAKRMRLEETK